MSWLVVSPRQLHLSLKLLLEAKKYQHAQYPNEQHSQCPKRKNQRMVQPSLFRNLACKNSLSYIACYAKANSQYVFLQRGYRNYGIPQVHHGEYSNNWLRTWQKWKQVWIILPTYREFATANARNVWGEDGIRLEIVSTIATRWPISMPSNMSIRAICTQNVHAIVNFAPVGSSWPGTQGTNAPYIVIYRITRFPNWSDIYLCL